MKLIKKLGIPLISAAFILGLLVFNFNNGGPEVHAAFPGSNGQIAWTDLEFGEEGPTSVDLVSSNMDGSDQTALFSSDGASIFVGPRYSADGQKLTYTNTNFESGVSNVYVASANGSNAVNVTNLDPAEEENVDEHGAYFSSFNPTGTKVIYGAHRALSGDHEDYADTPEECYIGVVNSDGSGQQRLTTSPQFCDMYPVWSPDGSKIAFVRIGYTPEDGDPYGITTASVYTMNTDGTNQTKVIDIGSDVDSSENDIYDNPFEAIAFAGTGEESYLSTIDWSPNGNDLVFARYTTDEEDDTYIAQIVVSDLEGNSEVIRERISNINENRDELDPEDSPVSQDLNSLQQPQFTPDGKVVFKELDFTITYTYDADNESWGDGSFSDALAAVRTINSDGSSLQTVTSYDAGDGPQSGYAAMYNLLMPSVQPVANNNQAEIANAETSKAIFIQTPEGTEITCSSAVKESELAVSDPGYNYPLGLVNFCFTTTEEDNRVSLTFVTNLRPDQVTARKYNSDTDKYFNLPESANAKVTKTTYQNQPALKLTYTITDNGKLDLDETDGQIQDPIGLAIRPGTLAATGDGLLYLQLVATASVITAAAIVWKLLASQKTFSKS